MVSRPRGAMFGSPRASSGPAGRAYRRQGSHLASFGGGKTGRVVCVGDRGMPTRHKFARQGTGKIAASVVEPLALCSDEGA